MNKQDFKTVLVSNQSKSLLFLIITIFSIIVLNAGLPLIQGGSKYTVNPVETTYGHYLILKEQDSQIALTYSSEIQLLFYKDLYKIQNPDLTAEEIINIEIPSTLRVSYYSAYFFESTGWWIASLVGVISAYLVFISIFNYAQVNRKEKDTFYKEKKNKIDKMNAEQLDPDWFEPWMENSFNKKRKLKQHISNVKYDISELDSKTSMKIKDLFKEYFKSPIPEDDERLPSLVVLPKMKWYNFKIKHYFERKKKLLSLLEEDYLKNYVPHIKVKHFKNIQSGFVYSGVNKTGRTTDEYSQIDSDKERLKKDSLKKVLSSIGTTTGFALMFTMSTLTTTEGEWYWYLFNAFSKLAPLVLQWIFALDYNNTFFDEQVYPNLDYRLSIGIKGLAENSRGEKNEEQ